MNNKADDHRQARGGRRDATVALTCAGIVFGMVGMAYAAVPLYKIFCQVTGFAGTTQRADQAPATVLDRTVIVAFDATVARELGWDFKPELQAVEVKLGESKLAFFKAHNRTDHEITGTASFNVTPEWVGRYFNKIECFCFTEQTLAAGETAQMPVTFFVDPEIVKDKMMPTLRTITLSYTFYPVAVAKPVAAAKERSGSGFGG